MTIDCASVPELAARHPDAACLLVIVPRAAERDREEYENARVVKVLKSERRAITAPLAGHAITLHALDVPAEVFDTSKRRDDDGEPIPGAATPSSTRRCGCCPATCSATGCGRGAQQPPPRHREHGPRPALPAHHQIALNRGGWRPVRVRTPDLVRALIAATRRPRMRRSLEMIALLLAASAASAVAPPLRPHPSAPRRQPPRPRRRPRSRPPRRLRSRPNPCAGATRSPTAPISASAIPRAASRRRRGSTSRPTTPARPA